MSYLHQGEFKNTFLSSYLSRFWPVCGLYDKHATIVNDDSSIIRKWSFKLIGDPRVIIYNCHGFIIQATGVNVLKHFLLTHNMTWNKLRHFSMSSFFMLVYNNNIDWLLIIHSYANFSSPVPIKALVLLLFLLRLSVYQTQVS